MVEIARGADRFVGTGGDADAAAGARLVDDRDVLPCDCHGVRRADAYARQAGDAQIGLDAMIHWTVAPRPGKCCTWVDRHTMEREFCEVNRAELQTIAYCLILRYSVRSPMPSTSAALRRLPCVSFSAASIAARSTSAIDIPDRYSTASSTGGPAETAARGVPCGSTSITSTRCGAGRSSSRRRSSSTCSFSST